MTENPSTETPKCWACEGPIPHPIDDYKCHGCGYYFCTDYKCPASEFEMDLPPGGHIVDAHMGEAE